MEIKYLEWDSDFFKKRIYKVDIPSFFLEEEHTCLNKIDADLVYVVTSDLSKRLSDTLLEMGAILYDKKVTYSKSIVSPRNVGQSIISFHSQSILTDTLEDMVYQSGSFSRFKIDPILNSEFRSMYKTWIDKSLKREIADEVYVAKDKEGNEIGFITLSKNESVGNIGLIAVDTKYRGKEVGMNLLGKADQWFYSNNITKASVVTQSDNIPACKLYEKMGYRIEKTENIFHLWKRKD